MLQLKFFVALSLIALAVADVTRYDGHKVLRVPVENRKQLKSLHKLVEGNALDVWSRDSALALGPNDIRVISKEHEQAIRSLAPRSTTVIEDVQALIDAQHDNLTADWYASYHRYEEIVEQLSVLAKEYSDIATFVPSIGTTVQGRAIPAIRITGSSSASPKRIYFQGGQHAREWIGPATVLYVISQLLSLYGTDPEVTAFVNEVEFVIVPLVNADGYEFSHTTTRLWRKNRRLNTGGSYGVDLNRNWDDHWGGAGSSSNPTSDTYHGTGPFSEPESKAASNYIASLGSNLLGAIDFHSYSQLILRPYGWTETYCPDETELKALGAGMKSEISATHGKSYTNERAIDLYITTGGASDWFYQEGIWAAYTIELRDTGTYGFVLPASQIIPTGQEIWNAVLYYVGYVLDNHPALKN